MKERIIIHRKELYKTIFFIFIPLSIWHDMRCFYFEKFNSVLFYIILKILFFILIYKGGYFFVKNIIVENKLNLKFLVSGIIFYILLIGLILIWPGNWVEVDEYSIYFHAKNMQAHKNQGLFISIIYILGLMIYDNPGMILILQILCVSGMFGSILVDIYQKTKIKRYCIYFLLVCFSPPSLYYIYQPMRTCLFSILILFFLHKFIKVWDNYKKNDLLFLTILISIIICIRTEIKFMLLIYPLLLVILFVKHKIFSKIILFKNVCIMFSILILYGIIGKIGGAGSSPIIQSLATPIYTILTDEKVDIEKLYKEVNDIDKIIPINQLLEKSTMGVSFAEVKTDYTEEEYQDFLESSLSLILRYPEDFVKCRLYALAVSLGLSKEHFYIQTVDNVKNWNPSQEPVELRALNSNMQSIVSNIIGGQFSIKDIHAYHILWAFWIPCIVSVFIFIGGLINRRFEIVLGATILLFQLIITTFLAPCHYTMYYFPNYIGGWGLFIEYMIKRKYLYNNL